MIMTRRFPVRCAFAVAVAWCLLVAGCASGPPAATRDFLDTETGVTVTSSRVPIVLYQNNPAMAAYARRVIYMGPIEVNRSGSYRYFLWLGAWTTDQPPDPVAQRDGLESIIVLVDGEPLNLDMAGWTPEAIGASRPVYVKPVASAVDVYYPVTIDQIRFMAAATDLSLRTTGASSAEYRLWDSQASARGNLQAFLEGVGY